MTITSLPILLLKDIVLFPYNEIRLELEKEEDKELISLAESYYNKHILIAYPSDTFTEKPIIKNISKYGVVGYISMKIELPNQKIRLVIRGLNRVQIEDTFNKDGSFVASIKEINVRELSGAEEVAYSRSLIKRLEYFIDHNPSMSNSVLSQILGINDINKITDILVNEMPISINRKLEYIKERVYIKRKNQSHQ